MKWLAVACWLLASLAQAAAPITVTVPAETRTIRCVSVDGASGDIVALKNSHDASEVIVYGREGTLKARFRPQSTPSYVAWLPGHRLLVSLVYPNRGKPPLVYEADGKEGGPFTTQYPALQMFRVDGKWVGTDLTPGSIIATPAGEVLMTSTWADEDTLKPEQLAAQKHRFDSGQGARVYVYSSEGKLLRTIGKGWGTDAGKMVQPKMLSLDFAGRTLAVGNKNGIDLFDLSSGESKGRLKDYELVASGGGDSLLVAKGKQLLRLNFSGKELQSYPPEVSGPFMGASLLSDGKFFLPGGPGLTVFRRYAADGQFLGAVGDAFAQITLTPPGEAVSGRTVDLQASLLRSDDYYAGRRSDPHALHAFIRSRIDEGPWTVAASQPKAGGLSIELPVDASGPKLLRLTLGDQPTNDLHMDATLRLPGRGEGSLTVLSPGHRRNFLAGEPLGFQLIGRAKSALHCDAVLSLYSESSHKTIATAVVPLDIRAAELTTLDVGLPEAEAKLLAPGNYVIWARANGMNSYCCRFTLSPAGVPGAMRILVWDSAFGPGEWDYPLERDELAAWAGINTVIRDMQNGKPLAAATALDKADAALFQDDPTLPPPQWAERPNDVQQMMDRGVRNGVSLLPIVQYGWEGFSVHRDETALKEDAKRIRSTVDSLKDWPSFGGLDYNVTNFFSHEWEQAYKSEAGKIIPPKDAGLGEDTRAYFDWLVGNFVKDYTAWGDALRASTRHGVRMATMTEADYGSWAPSLLPLIDVSQSYKQSEQILPPFDIAVNGSWASVPWLPHASTFEGFCETGTGERLNAEVGQAMLTGSKPGVVSPVFAGVPNGDRSSNTRRGIPYATREFFRRYQLVGDLLTTARATPQVGILLTRNQAIAELRSGNPFRGESTLWLRHYSAYLLLQMAHRSARALYGEHLEAGRGTDSLAAIVLAGQTAPLTDGEQKALAAFIARGGKVICDADTTVDVPGATKLSSSLMALEGFGFNGKHGVYQTDGTWAILPELLHVRLSSLTAELEGLLPATYSIDSPDVFQMSYDGGAVKYLALVNTRRPPVPDLQFAKMAARFSSVMPLQCRVRVPAETKVVYDVLAGRRLPVEAGSVAVDLRSYANTVLAISSQPLPKVSIEMPATVQAGQTITATIRAIPAAAAPVLAEIRCDDGVVIASRITATANDGIGVLEGIMPAGCKRVHAAVLGLLDRTPATATTDVEGDRLPRFDSFKPAEAAVDPPQPAAADAVSRFRDGISLDSTKPLEQQLAERTKPATARINSLAISTDGKTLVVSAANWDVNLFALNTADGRVKWSTHAGQSHVRQVVATANGGAAASILTSDDASHQLQLFSPVGQPLRRFAAPGVIVRPNGHYHQFFNEPQGFATVISADGSIVVGAANLAVAGWDASTGKLLWKKDLYQTIDSFASQPSARVAFSPDGTQVALLYCADGIFNKLRYSPKLEVCDAATGVVSWTFTPPPFDHVMARTPVWSSDGSHVLVGHASAAWEVTPAGVARSFDHWPGAYRPGTLELFDGDTLAHASGEAAWSLSFAGRPVDGQWTKSGDAVAVSTDLGELTVADPEGKTRWQTTVAGAAAVAWDARGSLYVGDWSGMLRCFDSAGREQWSVDLGQVRCSARSLPEDAYARPPACPLVHYVPAVAPDPKPEGHNVANGAKVVLCGQKGWGFRGLIAIDPGLLIDGKVDDLPRSWQDIDELWTSLIFDTPPQVEIRLTKPEEVTGLVVHESAAHPDAFPQLVFIDVQQDGKWTRGWQGYVSPSVEHTHTFKAPMRIQAVRYIVAACALNGVYTSEIEVFAK